MAVGALTGLFAAGLGLQAGGAFLQERQRQQRLSREEEREQGRLRLSQEASVRAEEQLGLAREAGQREERRLGIREEEAEREASAAENKQRISEIIGQVSSLTQRIQQGEELPVREFGETQEAFEQRQQPFQIEGGIGAREILGEQEGVIPGREEPGILEERGIQEAGAQELGVGRFGQEVRREIELQTLDEGLSAGLNPHEINLRALNIARERGIIEDSPELQQEIERQRELGRLQKEEDRTLIRAARSKDAAAFSDALKESRALARAGQEDLQRQREQFMNFWFRVAKESTPKVQDESGIDRIKDVDEFKEILSDPISATTFAIVWFGDERRAREVMPELFQVASERQEEILSKAAAEREFSEQVDLAKGIIQSRISEALETGEDVGDVTESLRRDLIEDGFVNAQGNILPEFEPLLNVGLGRRVGAATRRFFDRGDERQAEPSPEDAGVPRGTPFGPLLRAPARAAQAVGAVGSGVGRAARGTAEAARGLEERLFERPEERQTAQGGGL